ncbi:plasma membrane localization protein [Aspergillus viridinutans]|uniref:Plasma membrane localization protein n=1 Tax=Aspergillus viridinutans TaxID=75553 RepID=A0A9P3F1T9_ASPVI|nr:plasma membrane localization protein [Aspergillus viridinutans]GIK01814.1 plasma membrane localization protein [Aspergillus viridinutans]
MESVRQSCRPKHQVLVLKCYPQYQKGVQDVKPNSSELSYLLYYVSTRRSKLTKVGAFLEKRAARDVWRNKLGNVQVTLQILTALIEKVPRDLPLYARSVMTVLETVLRSGDLSMVEESISTFETFCRHQDMAALSAEQDFASQYREVVRTYADFADQTKSVSQLKVAPSGPMVTRWRTAGLRAIKGVVSSEAGLAADGGDSLRILLPVILECLYNGDESLLVSLELRLHEPEKNEPALGRRRRVSTATVQTVDAVDGDPALASQSAADVDRQAEMDMRLLALRCLERIVVTGSSRGQIRVTTKVVLQFIMSNDPLPEDGNKPMHMDSMGGWATSLVELVAKWCPVQVRFIILVSAMEMLLDVQPTEETLQRSYVLIFLIDWLLKSPVNMIGLSVIDILLGLMQFMSTLLSRPASAKSAEEGLEEKLNDHDVVLSAEKLEMLALLQSTIGDLTTHIYYGDQVVDMVRTILTRVKPSIDNKLSPAPALPNQSDNTEGSTNSAGFPGEMNAAVFSLPIAKVTALKAIKDILSVANSNRYTAAGVETRNPVGIHAWEGTQWLLREPDRDTRRAYIDALLTWLTLETTQDDIRATSRPVKGTGTLPKRESPEVSEKAYKRPLNVSQREKVIIAAQLNFLRLFHLTIYDIALDCPTDESEILLLHLLLTSLVERLGVNAVRFGLPMVLKLQEDLESVQSLRSPSAKVNIGSLVHGYLWAMCEKFDLEGYRVGSEIRIEIDRRKKNGLWLDRVRMPAVCIDDIIEPSEKSPRNGDVMSQGQLIPFKAGIEELVNKVEEAYNSSMSSPAHSPPASPGHNYALPVLGHGAATANSFKCNLPSSIKEQMLSPWSREACLAAAEKEKAEAMSINGSRHGTLGLRNYANLNGAGNSSHSIATSAHQSAFGAAAGLQHLRRTSIPDSQGTPVNGSGRESPVRVNELRRVLSVNVEGHARRLSPLRGRLDASDRSIVSSSSESMVSGFSLSEYDADGNSIRPQSIRDGRLSANGDGMETPKASSIAMNGGQSRQSSLSYNLQSDGIPPVPPIPPSISLPGGFSNDAQRSFANGERPSTAPGPRQVFTNGNQGAFSADNERTLSRHKSRSSTGLAAAANSEEASYVADGGPPDAALRRDVQNLINGFLSPMDAELRHGGTNAPGRRARSTHAGRRRATGGIGRPPY